VNLFGIVKLLLLKMSVGAIVLQGLIESFLYSSGASPYGDDANFDSEEKTLRAYCTYYLILHYQRCFRRFFLPWFIIFCPFFWFYLC
jgi:hypothetical protein